MDKQFSAIVIDDDPLIRDILEKFLEADGRVEIIKGLDSAKKAIEIIELYKPDIIFLDINMPYENGLQFASRLKKTENNPLLIFCTAFRNYALEAFELRPFDFLLKPFGIHELCVVIDKIEKHFIEKEKLSNKVWTAGKIGKYKLKTKAGYVFLFQEEILYVRSAVNHCMLVTSTGSYIKIYSTLSDVHDYIGCEKFLRISRSVVVNIDYIVNFNKKTKICLVKSDNYEQSLVVVSRVVSHLDDILVFKMG